MSAQETAPALFDACYRNERKAPAAADPYPLAPKVEPAPSHQQDDDSDHHGWFEALERIHGRPPYRVGQGAKPST